MSTGTGIEWTDATWNPVSGCTRVSAGCDNCYAVTMTHRLEAMGQPKYTGLTVLNRAGDRHFNGVVKCHEDDLEIPLRRRKPTMYFVNSMSDLFHKEVPFEFIDRVFAVMALCPQHTFQVLTKRPERMVEYLSDTKTKPITIGHMMGRMSQERDPNWRGGPGYEWPLSNVWLGTSCEDQAAADERIFPLLKCPTAVRFLSLEPLLGPIDIAKYMRPYFVNGHDTADGVDGPSLLKWLIVGGESGKDARPCNVDWIRSIVSQCKAAGVPVFVKQLGKIAVQTLNGENWRYWCISDSKGGEPADWPEDLRVREMPGKHVQTA